MFGGTQAELETVSAYREALKKLEQKQREGGAKAAGKGQKGGKDAGGAGNP